MISDGIKDIILSLMKTVKAIQMYGIAHPSSKNFYDPLYQKFSSFLRKNGVLDFQIEKFSIVYANSIVYEEKEKDISLAFRLFRDGIRNISFNQGLGFDELLLFLETISRVTKEQDIALSLWENNFIHISFYVVEEEGEISYRIPEIKLEKVDYEAKIDELIKREKIDLDERIDINLTAKEFNNLKSEISNVEKMSIIPVAITTLINFLKAEKSQEIIDSLAQLLEQCVDNKDFYNARRIVHTLQQYTDVNPIKNFENETTIIGFSNVINTSSDNVFNEFIAFLRFFSTKSVPYFIRLMTHIKRKDRLSVLRNRIASNTQDDPSPVLNLLDSKDTVIIINVIALIGLLKLKDTATLLQPLMNHTDPFVRVEIVTALEKAEKASIIARFIDDEESFVRIKTLQALTRVKYPTIYYNLLNRIKRKYFRDLEFAEQKEYFNCLVANGGKEVIGHLKKILFKWLLFGRKNYVIMRKLAAISLANITTEEASKILQRGLKKRNKDIKMACTMALRQK